MTSGVGQHRSAVALKQDKKWSERALSGLGRACGQRRNAQATRIGGITPSLKAGKYSGWTALHFLFSARIDCDSPRRRVWQTSRSAKPAPGAMKTKDYVHLGFNWNAGRTTSFRLGYKSTGHDTLWSTCRGGANNTTILTPSQISQTHVENNK